MSIHSYQIFDIKQLAELEHANKKECKKALLKYKLWCLHSKNQSDKMAIHYGNMEGCILRKQACQMISFYWTIRQDFRKAFEEYIKENTTNISGYQRLSFAA